MLLPSTPKYPALLPSRNRNISFLRLILFLLLMTSFGKGFSQNKKSYWSQLQKKWILSAGFGPANGMTDVNQEGFFPVSSPKNEWAINGNFALRLDINSKISFRGQIIYSGLNGVNEKIDRYYNSKFYETNFTIGIHLLPLLHADNQALNTSVLLFIGTGLISFDTELYKLSNSELVGLRGHGHGSGFRGGALEGIAILGGEFDYKLNQNWSISFETSFRWMKSDELDIYKSNGLMDAYHLTSVGLVYSLFHEFPYPVVKPLKK